MIYDHGRKIIRAGSPTALRLRADKMAIGVKITCPIEHCLADLTRRCLLDTCLG